MKAPNIIGRVHKKRPRCDHLPYVREMMVLLLGEEIGSVAETLRPCTTRIQTILTSPHMVVYLQGSAWLQAFEIMITWLEQGL